MKQSVQERYTQQPSSQTRSFSKTQQNSSPTQTTPQLSPASPSSQRTTTPRHTDHSNSVTGVLPINPSPTRSRRYSTNGIELDTLLATALLNAEYTLNAIRTLSTSVHCEQSEIGNNPSVTSGNATISLGTQTYFANGTRSNKSLTNDSLERGYTRQPTVADGKTYSRTPKQRKAVNVTRVLGNDNQNAPSPTDADIASVLNLQHSGVSPRDNQRSNSIGDGLFSDRYACLPVTGSKVKSHRLKLNNPFTSEQSITSKTCAGSKFKSRPSSGREATHKSKHSISTSTPLYEGGRDSKVQRLGIFESQLGSTIGGEYSFDCTSEIFEHAHSLSQKLHQVDNSVDNSLNEESGRRSEHAQLLSQKLHTVDEGSGHSEHAHLLSQRLHTVDNVMPEDESNDEEYSDYSEESNEQDMYSYDTSTDGNDSGIIGQLFFIS